MSILSLLQFSWSRKPASPEPLPRIQAFPAELLCIVFSLTHTSSSASRGIPWVHTLNRVCSFWRNVARELCPFLWTEIRILHFRAGQLEMLNEYLDRSSNLTLHVLVDAPSEVFEAAGRTEVCRVFLGLWSASDRWQTLSISTTPHNFSALENIIQRQDAPLLESLTLCDIRGHATLKFGSTPALKSLILRGVKLQAPETTSFVHQLESLELSSHGHADILIRLAEEFDNCPYHIRAAGPRLRHLSLYDELPSFNTHSRPLLHAYTRSLRSLTLGNRDPYYFHADLFGFTDICNLLDNNMPLLEELSFTHISASAWQRVCNLPPSLPALQTLSLSSVPELQFRNTAICRRLPALRSLVLREVDPRQFLESLGTPTSVSATTTSKDPAVVPWPGLRSLSLRNILPGIHVCHALRGLVEARIGMGSPLAVIEVDVGMQCCKDVKWLEEIVGEWRRVDLDSEVIAS
ncbi:hypothetical protein FB45DRAFT_902082 [Roridomyces roridus]|uniref:F-box domain-containing protein n=1 Tax=Roridomyces roridus TaxID=1738132 RepID=A0AAD7C9C5_9AGAR|nr:hypothetical protein FB45DRAFT_902082 [Roridomyces roridus]